MRNTIKINKLSSGVINSKDVVTVKGQVGGIKSIEDIPDVAEVDVSDGSTIVYNSSNDKYEVKKLDLDGGEF